MDSVVVLNSTRQTPRHPAHLQGLGGDKAFQVYEETVGSHGKVDFLIGGWARGGSGGGVRVLWDGLAGP